MEIHIKEALIIENNEKAMEFTHLMRKKNNLGMNIMACGKRIFVKTKRVNVIFTMKDISLGIGSRIKDMG